MPSLIHITRTENVPKIARGGIKPGKHNQVVYFMPLGSGHYISHQWARELKRFGGRNFSAIHFKLPGTAMVWYGHYHKKHARLPLGKALQYFREIENQLGYEFFIEQKIESSCISRIESIAKPMGWRFFPEAHGRRPCYCPACACRGEFGQAQGVKAWRNENRFEYPTVNEAKKILQTSEDHIQIVEALSVFTGKTRRDDPSFLFPVFCFHDEYIERQALTALGCFAHPKAREFLLSYRTADPELQSLIEEILQKRNWSHLQHRQPES